MLNNPKEIKDRLVDWIRDYFDHNGPGCTAVVGISGGKDSSVTAALCVEALGKDRVLGVLMPNGIQSDIADAIALVEHLDIKHLVVNIGDTTKALTAAIEGAEGFDLVAASMSRDSIINMPARIRMTTLYAVGQSLPKGGRVANTCNQSEDYVGYSTKYGDAAGDFSPLQNILVEEVRQLGHELGLPDFLIDKTPSDGLSGQTDEDKLGFTYAQLDHYILTGQCQDPDIKAKIDRMHAMNMHKLQLMPAFKK
ncbi:MAG: NAD(+) synthase [Veillonella sp.]|nr:NAD(+) synthase [Veillonella sp.]